METWLCIFLHLLYVCGIGYCIQETDNSDTSVAWDTGQNKLQTTLGFLQPVVEEDRSSSPQLEHRHTLVKKRLLDSIRFRAGIGLGKRLSLLKELQKNIQTTADLIRKTKGEIANDLTTKDMFYKMASKLPPYNADWHSSFPNPVVSKSKVRAKLQKADTFHDRSHLDPVVYWIGIGRR
ncbi:uncharacterized protein LOC121390441 isoform X2 [Gigantopelta aegis]|nr:uncharacterized protein LOC121390441 isoform X2 [Gigantopelta aegis]